MVKPIILALIALVVIGGGVAFFGGQLFAVSGLEQGVFCNIFEYQSCVLTKDSTAQGTVKSCLFDLCPKTTFTCNSDRCIITSCQSGCTNGVFAARLNNGPTFGMIYPYQLNTGDKLDLEGGGTVIFNYEIWNRHLKWCGASPCGAGSAGNDVAGSDKCTFVTDKSVYGNGGQLLTQPSSSQQSYTVPAGNSILYPNGQQFLCGTKFDQCTTDNDCAAGHSFLYNGKGAEASGGLLQIYGCVNRGTAPAKADLDYLPGLETKPATTQFNYGSKCEVVQTAAVQCIPGSTTCGASATCDVTTFTCKASGSVKCNLDADCGVGTVYDQQDKSYYRPICMNPGTASSSCSRQFIKKVQCAYTSECPSNWYCDIDGTCKESSNPKQSCPSVCCVGDPRYFDKPAPAGNVCCPGGQSFAPSLDKCTTPGPGPGGPGNADQSIPYALIFAALAGALTFALLKKDKMLAVIGGAIVAVIVYAILSFVLANWLLTLIVGGLAIYLFGGAAVMFILTIYLVMKK